MNTPDDPELHRLLTRQLRRLGLAVDASPDQASWLEFLHRINAAYHESDQQRYLLERSTAISSSELLELHDQLHWQATHDSLTGLPNRSAFGDALAAQLEDHASPVSDVALLYIDIDNFKSINDSYGHRCGDAVLTAVAQRLRGCTRTGELAARLAGDEFVVLCCAGAEHARTVARRIADALDQPIALGDRMLTCSASIGIAVRRVDESADVLLQRADQALYVAKRSGRGRMTIAEGDDVPTRQPAVVDEPADSVAI